VKMTLRERLEYGRQCDDWAKAHKLAPCAANVLTWLQCTEAGSEALKKLENHWPHLCGLVKPQGTP